MRIRLSQIKNRRGSACFVVLALLIIMIILLDANSVALHNLNRNLRRIEEKQLRRSGVNATNNAAIPLTNSWTNSINMPREHGQ
jgi:hypothetical protein